MPRATHPAPAALRNRNRVTNKTRLKVIKDTIEADSIVLDEDEEKARVVSTAGVDAEDANEHHLQAVLSAAASRHQAQRTTRVGDKDALAPTAYIPTPDSTGVVHNYAELYSAGRWKEPSCYIKSSDTTEEATSFALVNGFIYYMDERDKEWLDKNNEQARGEGMSTQSASATSSTRAARSAKAKGKEPDVVQPMLMTEDEFELVMAIFEKVTHEKTEFLHHGLEQGAPFPAFSEYQDIFASNLQPDMFALYAIPAWIPAPLQMLRFARLVFPYWRERRLDRGGHRIIPAVNLDESDTKNESYICFRRREIKAVRKTRASQTSYSDRMIRLQGELAVALDIVRTLQQREVAKRDVHTAAHVVWDRRQAFVDLKRANPALGSKDDDELLMDREKQPKKPKVDTSRVKIRPVRESVDTGSPVPLPIPQIRPRERQAAIQAVIDQELQRSKDNKWEDVIDNPYQAPPVPYGCRLFKPIAYRTTSSIATRSDDEPAPKYRSARLRTGRGRGRVMLDRRFSCTLRAAKFDEGDDEAKESMKRLEERFRYDDDDGFAPGPDGAEEHDRKLIDEHQPSRLLVSMSLLQNEDYGKIDLPTRLGSGDLKPYQLAPLLAMKAPLPPSIRQPPNTPVASSSTATSQPASTSTNGVPVSHPTSVKKLPQPNTQVHLRISNGRVVSGGNSVPNGVHTASPHATPPSSASASVNGFPDVQVTPAKSADPDVKTASQGGPTGVPIPPESVPTPIPSSSPIPAKHPMSAASVNVPNLPNGYHIPVNGYTAMPKGAYMHQAARNLSVQQMQTLTAMLPDNVNIGLRQSGAYVMQNGAYPVQMAGGRPIQWQMTSQHSPPNGVGVDGSGVQGTASSPSRAPSTNGARPPQRAPVSGQVLSASQMASPASTRIAHLTPHSPSPHILSPNMAAAQVNVHSSPPRAPQSAIPTPSPSLQSRQIVGGPGPAGY